MGNDASSILKRLGFFAISGFLALGLGLLALAGCANKQKGAGGKPATRVFKMAHVGPDDHPANKAAQDLVKDIYRETGGAIKIDLYPNAKLGNEKELVEGCYGGNIDFIAVTTTELSKTIPEFMLFDLPFFFESEEDAYFILDNVVGQELMALLPKHGFMGLAYYENGYRHLTNRDFPILWPKDLKGVKLRAQDSPIYVAMFQELGASPVTIDFTESWQALQQGVADGADGSLPIIYYNRWFEVNKFLTLTRHTYQPMAVIANKDIWETIAPEHQKVLKDVFKRYEKIMRGTLTRYNDRHIQKIKDRGMTVVELNPEQRAAFKKITERVARRFASKMGKERVDRVTKALLAFQQKRKAAGR